MTKQFLTKVTKVAGSFYMVYASSFTSCGSYDNSNNVVVSTAITKNTKGEDIKTLFITAEGINTQAKAMHEAIKEAGIIPNNDVKELYNQTTNHNDKVSDVVNGHLESINLILKDIKELDEIVFVSHSRGNQILKQLVCNIFRSGEFENIKNIMQNTRLKFLNFNPIETGLHNIEKLNNMISFLGLIGITSEMIQRTTPDICEDRNATFYKILENEKLNFDMHTFYVKANNQDLSKLVISFGVETFFAMCISSMLPNFATNSENYDGILSCKEVKPEQQYLYVNKFHELESKGHHNWIFDPKHNAWKEVKEILENSSFKKSEEKNEEVSFLK